MSLAEITRQFWSAAYFYRRAPDRDNEIALAVLGQVAQSAPSTAQSRALDLLKDIANGTGPSSDTPGHLDAGTAADPTPTHGPDDA